MRLDRLIDKLESTVENQWWHAYPHCRCLTMRRLFFPRFLYSKENGFFSLNFYLEAIRLSESTNLGARRSYVLFDTGY